MFGRKFACGLATAAALSACGETQGTTTTGSKDAVNVAFSSQSARQGMRGLQPDWFRADVTDPSSPNIGKTSVPAQCVLNGEGYSASFSAPATVNMPNYGARTRPVSLTCNYEGMKATRSVKAVNFSQNQRDAKSSNMVTGLILLNPGALVGGAAAGVSTNEDGSDIYGYPDVSLALN